MRLPPACAVRYRFARSRFRRRPLSDGVAGSLQSRRAKEMFDIFRCVVALDREANEDPTTVSGHGNFDPTLQEQSFAQCLGVLHWNRDHHHLGPVIGLRSGRQTMASGHHFNGVLCEDVAVLANGRPIKAILKPKRSGHSQPWRDVSGTLPLHATLKLRVAEVVVEPRVSAGVIGVTPTHDGCVKQLMVLGSSIQKARTLWCAQPLVAVSDIEVCADGVEIDGDLPRGVSAIDERGNATLARSGADFRHG